MQSVLITGANSGIGRAAALRLASAGHRVHAAMRSLAKGEKLAKLAAEAGVDVHPVELDVGSEGSVQSAVEQVGRVDVLINNAGVGFNATTEDVDIEAAKAVFDTNYWGVIRCVQAVMPQMRERGEGHIVNVSSIAGRIAAIGQPIYSSSKWALECLSENLAQEAAYHGIRVSVIEPGVARTAILPKNVGHPEPTAYEPHYRRMLQFYAKGIQVGIPAEDVAETILHSIEDPDPRFRYTCAWGGEELPAGRERMSDAEWVALGAIEDDQEYYAEFERLFGLSLALPGGLGGDATS
ncbi:MAG: SDR family oxidoreductase [Myxococcota bacterium]|nr:SDR family oxidoreductase [Myxococcota bacterium]